MEDAWRNTYPYIKYDIPNGPTFLLTPRPDAYTAKSVADFLKQWNPVVRFQFTDDIPDYSSTTPVHWYPWVPGKPLPTELVWAALCLINRYAFPGKVIWMHCDSSSMRAPTFFGLWLKANYSDEFAQNLVKGLNWTDGRGQSCPVEYSDTSLRMDSGMKALIDAWREGGEKAAYGQLMHVPYPWEKT